MAMCKCKLHGLSGMVLSCAHIWEKAKDRELHFGVTVNLDDMLISSFVVCEDCFGIWNALVDENSKEAFLESLKPSCIKCFDATDMAALPSIRTIQCKEHDLAAAVMVSPMLSQKILLREKLTSDDILTISFKYQGKIVETYYLDCKTAKRFNLKSEILPLGNNAPNYVIESKLVCFRCFSDSVNSD